MFVMMERLGDSSLSPPGGNFALTGFVKPADALLDLAIMRRSIVQMCTTSRRSRSGRTT